MVAAHTALRCASRPSGRVHRRRRLHVMVLLRIERSGRYLTDRRPRFGGLLLRRRFPGTRLRGGHGQRPDGGFEFVLGCVCRGGEHVETCAIDAVMLLLSRGVGTGAAHSAAAFPAYCRGIPHRVEPPVSEIRVGEVAGKDPAVLPALFVAVGFHVVAAAFFPDDWDAACGRRRHRRRRRLPIV